MEQSDTSKTHHHSIFIASLNHSIITHRSTRLRNILHATLMSTLNIITEWEECIRSQCNIRHLIQPCTFLFLCKYFRFLCESFLLALKPELLLLDEPFSALDSQTRLSVSDDIGRILHQEKRLRSLSPMIFQKRSAWQTGLSFFLQGLPLFVRLCQFVLIWRTVLLWLPEMRLNLNLISILSGRS